MGQRAAKLQAVKVGGLKKFCQSARVEPFARSRDLSPGQMDYRQSLIDHNFGAL